MTTKTKIIDNIIEKILLAKSHQQTASMSSNPSIVPDEYLGDGVYVRFDGYHIWLDLRDQDPTIEIALDYEVIKDLGVFIEKVLGP